MVAVLGALTVRPLDETGQPTPVRMEIIDDAGHSHIPLLALPVELRCPSAPVPNESPGCMTGFAETSSIDNPHTGTRQFYADGEFDIDLPPGHYALAAYKGIEYSVARLDLIVTAKAHDPVVVPMKRWANMPSQ